MLIASELVVSDNGMVSGTYDMLSTRGALMMGACCDERLKESKFATGDGMGRLCVVNWHEVRVDL